jgi:hypothetical protein
MNCVGALLFGILHLSDHTAMVHARLLRDEAFYKGDLAAQRQARGLTHFRFCWSSRASTPTIDMVQFKCAS